MRVERKQVWNHKLVNLSWRWLLQALFVGCYSSSCIFCHSSTQHRKARHSVESGKVAKKKAKRKTYASIQHGLVNMSVHTKQYIRVQYTLQGPTKIRLIKKEHPPNHRIEGAHLLLRTIDLDYPIAWSFLSQGCQWEDPYFMVFGAHMASHISLMDAAIFGHKLSCNLQNLLTLLSIEGCDFGTRDP